MDITTIFQPGRPGQPGDQQPGTGLPRGAARRVVRPGRSHVDSTRGNPILPDAQRRPALGFATMLVAALLAQPAAADERVLNGTAQRGTAWSGAWLGIFAGMGTSAGRAVLNDSAGTLIPTDVEYGLFPRSISHSHTGGMFGLGLGYDRQSGRMVGGVELDLQYLDTAPRAAYSRIDNVPSSPFPGVSTNTSYGTDFGLLATLRGRAGYTFGKTLVFGTAGLAAGRVRNRFDLSLPEIGYGSSGWSSAGTRFGYVAGFGVEHRMTRKVNLKLEMLYVDLGDRIVHGADPAAFPGEALSYRFTNELIIARFGISARF